MPEDNIGTEKLHGIGGNEGTSLTDRIGHGVITNSNQPTTPIEDLSSPTSKFAEVYKPHFDNAVRNPTDLINRPDLSSTSDKRASGAEQFYQAVQDTAKSSSTRTS